MPSLPKSFYLQAVAAARSGLGIDASYFIKGGVWGVIQQVVGLSSGLAIAYAFGHFASKSLFGEYNLVLSIVSILAIVSIPGLNTALLRSVGEGYDNSLNQAAKTKLLWSLLGIPALITLAYYYRLRGSDVLPTVLLVTAAFFPLLHAFQITYAFFIAKKRFDLQAVFSSLSSLLTAGLVVTMVVLTQNLTLILMGYFLGITLPALASLLASFKLAKKSKPDKDLLAYGYFLTGLQILPIIVGNVSDLLLAAYLGVEQLAVFAVASKFPGIVQKNFDVFFKPITAKLANQSAAEHRLTLKRHWQKFMVMGGLMFVGLWLLLPILIRLLYGHQYEEAIGYGRLYSWLVLILPVSWLFGDLITFQKRKQSIFFLSTALPLLKLMAYFLVIPRWQITGLIVIMLAERFITTIYSGLAVILTPAR